MRSASVKLYMYLVCAIGLSLCSAIEAKGLSFSSAVKKASPAVVSIQADRSLQAELTPFMNDPFFKHFYNDDTVKSEDLLIMRALGSGVIISKEGHILTNYHVIKDTKSLVIKLEDGREFPGTVIAVDPPSDLGVVKITGNKLPVAVIGDSEAMEIGDVVLAIGNPFGVGQTVTQGIVSAVQRKNLGLNLYEGYIQTDAAINPGNSGGALIDLNGQLIGINAAILSRSGGNNGIGFAIPMGYAQQIMNDLISIGQVERGWVGIVMADFNADIRAEFHFKGHGVLIRAVYADSPAAQAGLLPGDILIKINNKTVKDASDVRQWITQLREKDRAQLTVIRAGKERTCNVIVGLREPML